MLFVVHINLYKYVNGCVKHINACYPRQTHKSNVCYNNKHVVEGNDFVSFPLHSLPNAFG